MVIIYDTPIEVSKVQLDFLNKIWSSTFCYRRVEDKFFIKVWSMRYANHIGELLLKNFLIYGNH